MTAAALAAPVAALIARCGAPVHVASAADGNHFTFDDDGAIVDALVDADTAGVRALDVRAAPPAAIAVSIAGEMHDFPFGRYEIAQADAELAAHADVAFATTRAYTLDERSTLVLTFDPVTRRLARVTLGARPLLERLDLLPPPIDHPPYSYRAPAPKRVSLRDGGGSRGTIVRVDVDRYGIVRSVAIVVPSADAAFDAALPARLGDDVYEPAQLGGRPVAGSVFRDVLP